jgi:hypothetical protein
MPAAKPQLKSLVTRKQLLVIESQVNRAQLKHDWEDFGIEMRTATAPARTAISAVQGMLSIFRQTPKSQSAAPNGEHKSSAWLAPLLDSARLGASLWDAFRARKR